MQRIPRHSIRQLAFPPSMQCRAVPCRLASRPTSRVARPARRAARVAATADFCELPDDWREPPSLAKRRTLNILVAGACALPAASMLGPFAASFVPNRRATRRWLTRAAGPVSGSGGGPASA